MNLTVPLTSLPPAVRAEALRLGRQLGSRVELAARDYARLTQDPAFHLIHPGRPPLDSAAIAAREALCATCPWNVDWICEHSGCKPCAQRQSGGLRTALRSPTFRCASNKF